MTNQLTIEQVRNNNQAFAAALPAELVTDLRRQYQDERQLMEALKEALREQIEFNEK